MHVLPPATSAIIPAYAAANGMNLPADPRNARAVASGIKRLARSLGFQSAGISSTDLSRAEAHLRRWLADGFHGEMSYMARHGTKRSRPGELVPGTLSIVSVSMDYMNPSDRPMAVLEDPAKGYVSRYAVGRDYHKLMRQRLQRLATQIGSTVGPFGYRVFVDSAPVLEKAIAEKAGIGWIGKHSNLVSTSGGGWFFLGEIYTDMPLPPDTEAENHCGRCTACIDLCPTGAIVAPYRVDARRCVSYLTIELRGSIPEPLRPLMGNRIYGCDDCILACPWNRFARSTGEADFLPRQGLASPDLVALFLWDEATFLKRLEGSPIRRIGHACWLRNIAVALGNGETTHLVLDALHARLTHPSDIVREHVLWALSRHSAKA